MSRVRENRTHGSTGGSWKRSDLATATGVGQPRGKPQEHQRLPGLTPEHATAPAPDPPSEPVDRLWMILPGLGVRGCRRCMEGRPAWWSGSSSCSLGRGRGDLSGGRDVRSGRRRRPWRWPRARSGEVEEGPPAPRVMRAAVCNSRYRRRFRLRHRQRRRSRRLVCSQAVRSWRRGASSSQAALIATSRDGSRPGRCPCAQRMRSSTRAWARWRASRNASHRRPGCWWRRSGSGSRRGARRRSAAHRGGVVRGAR